MTLTLTEMVPVELAELDLALVKVALVKVELGEIFVRVGTVDGVVAFETA